MKCLLLASLVFFGAEGLAHSAPLVNSRVGGLALIGPASPHPASMYYNPAALGLTPGYHVYLSGGALLDLAGVQRDATVPNSGAASTQRLPEERSLTAAPQLYASLSSDFGTESVVLGLAFHTPSWDGSSFLKGADSGFVSPDIEGATRYHATDFLLKQYYVTIGAALHLGAGWYLGLSASYVRGELDFAFVRDIAPQGGSVRDPGEAAALDDCGQRPCGFESNLAAEGLRVSGVSNGLGFGGGIVGRIGPRILVGVGYISHILGLGGDSIPSKGDVWLRRAEAAVLPGEQRDLKGRSLVSYQLPDSLNIGLNWALTASLNLDFQLRWMLYRRHRKLAIELSGSELRQASELPALLLHNRGFQDSFAFQTGVGYTLGAKWRLTTALMLESSAVPAARLNAKAIDGWKADAFVSLIWQPRPRFLLRLGYGIVAMLPTEGGDAFNSQLLVDCVDSGYNMDEQACRQAVEGLALPNARGSYWRITQRVDLALSYSWQ